MSPFETASGISVVDINYFFIALLVVLTIIGVGIGFIDLLRTLRTGQIEGISIIANISKGVAAIIAVIALIYFITL